MPAMRSASAVTAATERGLRRAETDAARLCFATVPWSGRLEQQSRCQRPVLTPVAAAACGSICARAAWHGLREKLPIVFKRTCNIVEQAQPTSGENGRPVAILPDRVMVMRGQYNVRMPQAFAKRRCASAAEPLIADFGNLIDQVHVEIDRQA